MKKYLTIMLFFFALSLPAQTAAEMDTLLGTQAVSAARAARFVLGAAGLLPQGLSGAEAETAAYDMALSNGWLKGAAADPVTLQGTAFLVMAAFEFRGGLMYSLLHNPRYAYREMAYRRIIQGDADPAMLVSGPTLLQIIGRSLDYAGDYR